jgi:hypothetical protein
MLSRMKDFWYGTFSDEKGRPKQGHEYRILYNIFDSEEIGIILRWHDGRLQDDGELPAVEFQDAHIEHYRSGILHNDSHDEKGALNPAIISGYGTQVEYFINGRQVTE